MKTLDNTLETGNRSRVRSLLAIVGVVTAIIALVRWCFSMMSMATLA